MKWFQFIAKATVCQCSMF